MLLAAAVALALLFLPQQPAAANGVHFDPNSPAGKEYALPLDQARDEAAGVGKSDGPAGKKAPLFGEGVSSGGSGSGPGAGDGSGAVGKAATGDVGGGAGRTHVPAAAIVEISGADGAYALSSAILWVAAIVALGGIVALVLRGLQRPRP